MIQILECLAIVVIHFQIVHHMVFQYKMTTKNFILIFNYMHQLAHMAIQGQELWKKIKRKNTKWIRLFEMSTRCEWHRPISIKWGSKIKIIYSMDLMWRWILNAARHRCTQMHAKNNDEALKTKRLRRKRRRKARNGSALVRFTMGINAKYDIQNPHNGEANDSSLLYQKVKHTNTLNVHIG